MSERTEWAVVHDYSVPYVRERYKTREEAEAFCRAHNVVSDREDQELAERERKLPKHENGLRITGFMRTYPRCYVASRRVTDWERVED